MVQSVKIGSWFLLPVDPDMKPSISHPKEWMFALVVSDVPDKGCVKVYCFIISKKMTEKRHLMLSRFSSENGAIYLGEDPFTMSINNAQLNMSAYSWLDNRCTRRVRISQSFHAMQHYLCNERWNKENTGDITICIEPFNMGLWTYILTDGWVPIWTQRIFNPEFQQSFVIP